MIVCAHPVSRHNCIVSVSQFALTFWMAAVVAG